jgi:hypothetical protein
MDLTGVLSGTEPDASPAPPPGRRRRAAHRRLDVALTLLLVGVATTWALLTPPLRAPDEPQHLNSVLRLAYGGGWPEPGTAVLAPAVQQARDDVALATDVPGRWIDRNAVRQFADAAIVPGPQRARVDAATALPGDERATPDDVDQMTQHPPLYYALGAGVLHVTGLADARWDHQLLALRLFDVLLLAPLVPLASWSARRLTGSAAAGAVAATFPLLVPQVGHILGSVTNDALVTLVGSVVVALLVRVLTGDRGLRTAAVIGVVVGVGLLTKVMAAFLLPAVALAYLLSPGGTFGARVGDVVRRRDALGGDALRVLVAGTVALVVGGWWWVRNLVVYGVVQPTGMLRIPEESDPEGPLGYVVKAWRTLAMTFFGDFGWLDLRTPQLYWLTSTVLLLALGAVALFSRRTWRPALTLITLPTVLTVGIIANAWDYYMRHGMIVGIQGRYLFAALAALAVVVAVAVHRLAGESRMRFAVPVVLVVGVATTVYGLLYAARGFYRGPGQSVGEAWERWQLLSPVPAAWLVVVPGVTALVALAALLIAGRPVVQRPRAEA